MTVIQERLFALQDADYAAFQRPLIPTVEKETFIGAAVARKGTARHERGGDISPRPAACLF